MSYEGVGERLRERMLAVGYKKDDGEPDVPANDIGLERAALSAPPGLAISVRRAGNANLSTRNTWHGLCLKKSS